MQLESQDRCAIVYSSGHLVMLILRYMCMLTILRPHSNHVSRQRSTDNYFTILYSFVYILDITTPSLTRKT